MRQRGKDPLNMTELGRFWVDAASIGPVPNQFWHIMACLHGMDTEVGKDHSIFANYMWCLQVSRHK